MANDAIDENGATIRGRTALITGASSGIGKAFAELFAARGWNVAVTARRLDRLEALASELAAKHRIVATPIALDLAAPDSVERLLAETGARGLAIDALVNNAGYGVPGAYARTSWSAQKDFLRVLVTAPCELTHALLPGMIERRFGRIVNVASVAGLVPGTPGHTLYAAAKAFMIKFSESLLVENRARNVLTTALCPGFTHSEFHDVTGVRESMSRFSAAWWSTAEEVAEAGYEGVMRGRSIVITGTRARQVAALAKLLPQPIALRIMAGRAKSFRVE
jgi:short-subunit dehydrogenase